MNKQSEQAVNDLKELAVLMMRMGSVVMNAAEDIRLNTYEQSEEFSKAYITFRRGLCEQEISCDYWDTFKDMISDCLIEPYDTN